MMEFGIVMEPSPGNTSRAGWKIEGLGFDILLSPDTKNLSPDPIGQLNLAGANTTSLRVGTGVTNRITRDPAHWPHSPPRPVVELCVVLGVAIPAWHTLAKAMPLPQS